MTIAPALQLTTLSAVALLYGCATYPPAPREALTPDQVRTEAASLEGKSVLVKGYLTYHYENHSLWLDAESADALRQRNCVGLLAPDALDLMALKKKHIVIRGKVVVLSKETVFFNACTGVVLDLGLDASPAIISKGGG